MSKIETTYRISTDPNFLDAQNCITPELSIKLEKFHKMALGGNRSSVKKILDAIEQYPDNPQLKNYLSVLYANLNETKKMYDTNRWIIAEHPDYLFGKINLANEYFLEKEYDKIKDVLGPEMELKALYPKRDTFHLNEVVSFYKFTVLYFIAIDDLEQAQIRCDMIQELAPDSDDARFVMTQVLVANMSASQKRFEEEEKTKIKVETKAQNVKVVSAAPKFTHSEIEWLYCNGLYIEAEKLNTILALPRETLIADLELVLQDSIDRYGYFNKLVNENDWDEEKMNFIVHAIYILGELKATDSIEHVFKVLSQSDEYFDLYLGDFLTSMLWEPIYKMAANNLEACKQFMFKPGIDTFARTTMPDMVEQFALHHPEKRNIALNWFKEVIQFFLNSKIEDNVIDSDVIALLICNVIDIKGSELLPEIEMLFERNMVSMGICGDWEEVCKAFKRPDKYNKRKEILPIAERYIEITSTWACYNEEEGNSEFDYNDIFEPPVIPIRAEPKVGRNDPCNCGSGKKYKKCCLNK